MKSEPLSSCLSGLGSTFKRSILSMSLSDRLGVQEPEVTKFLRLKNDSCDKPLLRSKFKLPLDTITITYLSSFSSFCGFTNPSKSFILSKWNVCDESVFRRWIGPLVVHRYFHLFVFLNE